MNKNQELLKLFNSTYSLESLMYKVTMVAKGIPPRSIPINMHIK